MCKLHKRRYVDYTLRDGMPIPGDERNEMTADEGDDPRADVESGRRLAGQYARLERFRRSHQQNMRLGTADLRILWLFTDGSPRTLKEIAHELGLEQSTVNRQVNAAVADGLLEKTRPTAGSAFHVVSTEAGRDAFEKDVAISLQGYEAALRTLGEADSSQLLELLERFVAAYGSLAPGDDAS